MTDASHEDHERPLEWSGGSFDPDEFDLAAVNQRLSEFELLNGRRGLCMSLRDAYATSSNRGSSTSVVRTRGISANRACVPASLIPVAVQMWGHTCG
ncbi:protein of unknown function (plasmid) [Caballeronia sp. S22]